MTRREFLDRLTEIAGSAAAAAALLPLLQNNYAKAETVPANDPALASENDHLTTRPRARSSGYLARAKAKGKRPAIVVIHENRGLNPHIPGPRSAVGAGRLPRAGARPAVGLRRHAGGRRWRAHSARKDQSRRHDRRSRRGGVLPEESSGIDRQGRRRGLLLRRRHGQSRGHDSPELDAAVVYYGDQPPADKSKVADIKAPLLLHYAGLDDASTPAFRPMRRR